MGFEQLVRQTAKFPFFSETLLGSARLSPTRDISQLFDGIGKTCWATIVNGFYSYWLIMLFPVNGGSFVNEASTLL